MKTNIIPWRFSRTANGYSPRLWHFTLGPLDIGWWRTWSWGFRKLLDFYVGIDLGRLSIKFWRTGSRPADEQEVA